MKTTCNSLFVIVLLALSFYLLKDFVEVSKDQYNSLTKISSQLFDFNFMKIEVSEDLSLNDFTIKNINSGKTIYRNGKYIGGIKNEYGHCQFEIYHKGNLIFEIGHEKLNNWHTNEYLLDIKITNQIIDPTLVISGPDDYYGDFYYKRFEKSENGLFKKVYLNKSKEIYNVEL